MLTKYGYFDAPASGNNSSFKVSFFPGLPGKSELNGRIHGSSA